MRVWGLINRKASMTTLPLTDCMGSTTTATARGVSCSKDCCVLMSTEDNQQPNPGCEWYHPTTVSGLCSGQLGRSWNIAVLCMPSGLPQHVHHLSLKDRVHSLNAHSCTTLWHSKHIDNAHGVVIHELAQHQPHDFHRYTGSAMP